MPAPLPSHAGLTTAEARTRLVTDGPNEVAAPRPRRLIGRIGRQLADPLVALLLAAAVVTTVLRDLPGIIPLDRLPSAVSLGTSTPAMNSNGAPRRTRERRIDRREPAARPPVQHCQHDGPGSP